MARVTPLRRPSLRERLADIRAGVCPRCRRGRIFRGRFAMAPECPACGFRFEREAGYFVGAMYVSYALAVPLLAALTGVVYLVAPRLSFEATVGVAALLFLPWVPVLFRTSRVLWIHLDHTVDPPD
jgi:uncharacterized protein (DUF983 family)